MRGRSRGELRCCLVGSVFFFLVTFIVLVFLAVDRRFFEKNFWESFFGGKSLSYSFNIFNILSYCCFNKSNVKRGGGVWNIVKIEKNLWIWM